MVYSTRRFVVCLSVCHFVLVFFSPFCIAITSLGEERANLSVFRTFVRFVLVWICRFPLPLGVWEWLRFVIVALPGLFSYLFSVINGISSELRSVTTELPQGSVLGPVLFVLFINDLLEVLSCCKTFFAGDSKIYCPIKGTRG